MRTRELDALVFGLDVAPQEDSRRPAVVALIAEKARRSVDRLHVKLQIAVPARLEAALLALILDPLVHCPSVKRQSVFPRELFPTFQTDESQALVLELDVLY